MSGGDPGPAVGSGKLLIPQIQSETHLTLSTVLRSFCTSTGETSKGGSERSTSTLALATHTQRSTSPQHNRMSLELEQLLMPHSQQGFWPELLDTLSGLTSRESLLHIVTLVCIDARTTLASMAWKSSSVMCAPCATCAMRSDRGECADVRSRWVCETFSAPQEKLPQSRWRGEQRRTSQLSAPKFPALRTRTRSQLASHRLPTFVNLRGQGSRSDMNPRRTPCFSPCLPEGLDPAKDRGKTSHSVPIHPSSQKLDHRQP